MKEESIVLEEPQNLLRLKITTKSGKETGEILEFNLKDIDLLDRLQKMKDDSKKNYQMFNNELIIIEKKQDFQKKGQIMTNNEKAKYEALKKYLYNQKKVYDMFLGEGGVDKILCGRAFEYETLLEIDKIINNQIVPRLDITMDNIIKDVKEKYSKYSKNRNEVLK